MSRSCMRFRRIAAQATTKMPSAADFGCGRKEAALRPSRPPRNDALESSEKVPQMAARSEISRSRPTGTLAAWRALADHQRAMQGRHLRDLFADDPARGERMTAEAAGIFLDYSKNRIDDE